MFNLTNVGGAVARYGDFTFYLLGLPQTPTALAKC